MRFKTPAQHKSIESFREHWLGLAPELGCATSLQGCDGPLGSSRLVAGRELTNRFAVHPMEGWDGHDNGLPSEHTLRRWRRFGRSGAKLVWGGEAFAVQRDGRANPQQLYLNPEVDCEAGLVALHNELRAGHEEVGEDPDELFVGLQLTHSGRFARPHGQAAPRVPCRHPVLDARFDVDEGAVLSDAELEAIAAQYVRSAELAARVGFDFVDVKCCHGYLLHELLGARTRPGPYGGDFAGRTRLFETIVAGIRAACPDLVIGVRVSIGDIHPFSANPQTGVGEAADWRAHTPFEHGFGVDRDDPRELDLEEPMRYLALVESLGIELVNVTLGSPYYCPHLQRPAAYPPSDGYLPPEDPLLGVAQHLRAVRACKARFPELCFVGTGYSYLQEWLAHVAEHEVGEGHVDFVGLGRMVLSYPELPLDVLAGRELDHRRICRTLSDCTTAPRNGIISGCFPLDPYYKERPEAAELQRAKEARRRGPR